MEHVDRVEAVAREVDALAAALATGPMFTQVPTCPGWTVGDLARHVGGFCGFWTHDLCEAMGRDKPPFAEPTEADELPEWFAKVGDDLLKQLRATPAQTTAWTWYPPDQTARFVARRCAHELAVHRYDVEAARGRCQPIDRALAVDGIDEVLDTLVGRCDRTGQARGETIHLHGTDQAEDEAGNAAEWLITMQPDQIEVARTHAKGDLALRGAVSDLELLLYGRPILGPVERFGDDAVLDLWHREFAF